MTNWRWKYFTRDELKSKDDGSLVINEDALNKLEKMRELMGAPLKINSAYRSPAYNKRVGGANNSMHVQGRAFDIAVAGHDSTKLYQAAIEAGFTGFGFYRTFLHVDTGAKRWWGKYRSKYEGKGKSITKPIQSLSVDKETEKPNKIEGVALSDKQKVAAVTTGVAGASVLAVDPNIIIEHAPAALSLLKELDWRVALAVIFVVGLGGLIWWKWGRK